MHFYSYVPFKIWPSYYGTGVGERLGPGAWSEKIAKKGVERNKQFYVVRRTLQTQSDACQMRLGKALVVRYSVLVSILLNIIAQVLTWKPFRTPCT